MNEQASMVGSGRRPSKVLAPGRNVTARASKFKGASETFRSYTY